EGHPNGGVGTEGVGARLTLPMPVRFADASVRRNRRIGIAPGNIPVVKSGHHRTGRRLGSSPSAAASAAAHPQRATWIAIEPVELRLLHDDVLTMVGHNHR